MSQQFPKILVLGTSGMLGRIVFKYLYSKYSEQIFGTTRKIPDNKNIFHFNANQYKTGLEKLKKRKYEYFINCIGILRGAKNRKEMSFVNSKFPIILDKYCKKNGIKLIHISTDAVFSDQAGIVYESSKPNPTDYYGRTKLAGEVKKGLNIRTSIIGLDPTEKKGLLELTLKKKGRNLVGFEGQEWSGATTLQIARFLEWIIFERKFNNIRKTADTIHFAPIDNATKYEIIKVFSYLVFKKKVKKGNTPKQTRILKTHFFEKINIKRYIESLEKALKELIEFDSDYVKKHA